MKKGMAGMVQPPTRVVQPPVLGHAQSPLGQAIQNKGNAGRYAGGMGLAPARPPRIPIQSTMRNIDAGTNKRFQLKALGGRIRGYDAGGTVSPTMTDEQINAWLRAAQIQHATNPSTRPEEQSRLQRLRDYMAQRQQQGAAAGAPPRFDEGGQVTPPPDGNIVHQVVMTALKHLEGMDASTAAAVLRSSPEAMSHPEIAAVAQALTTSSGITPATKQLNQISQAGSESPVQQTQQLRAPAGAQPQMPAGGSPQGPAQPPGGGPNQPPPRMGAPGPSPMMSSNRPPSAPGR